MTEYTECLPIYNVASNLFEKILENKLHYE